MARNSNILELLQDFIDFGGKPSDKSRSGGRSLRETSIVPGFLGNVGAAHGQTGVDIRENPSVLAAYTALNQILGREGATSAEGLARIAGAQNEAFDVDVSGDMVNALANAKVASTRDAEAVEAGITDERKRADLNLILDFFLQPAMRNAAKGLKGIQDDLYISQQRDARRNQLYQGIQNILSGAADLYKSYKTQKSQQTTTPPASSGGSDSGGDS